MSEPRLIAIEREGGFILAWKTNIRMIDGKATLGGKGGEPVYAHLTEGPVFPTREEADAEIARRNGRIW